MPLSHHIERRSPMGVAPGEASTRIGLPNLPDTAQNGPPEYVSWEPVSLQHFVNRYIRTRQRPVNRGNRLAVQEGLSRYRGSFPARCKDVEAFLDSILLATES